MRASSHSELTNHSLQVIGKLPEYEVVSKNCDTQMRVWFDVTSKLTIPSTDFFLDLKATEPEVWYIEQMESLNTVHFLFTAHRPLRNRKPYTYAILNYRS